MVMTVICFLLPDEIREQLDLLVRKGYYSKRAQIIRIAIRDLLKDRKLLLKSVEDIERDYDEKNRRKYSGRFSLKIPREIKEELDSLVKQGIYPNKSEIVRVSILNFLKREITEQ